MRWRDRNAANRCSLSTIQEDHRVVSQRDLYILEQRGIGNSGDFCRFYGSRNVADTFHADRESAERASLDQTAACIESAIAAGVDVTGYNTRDTVESFGEYHVDGVSDINTIGIKVVIG